MPVHWKIQFADSTAGPWRDIKEYSSYQAPTYPTQQETVPVGQAASWGSGVSWSNNNGETGVGSYEREYAYDKVGNRYAGIE